MKLFHELVQKHLEKIKFMRKELLDLFSFYFILAKEKRDQKWLYHQTKLQI